jgi:hypothetical protein
MVQEYLSAGVYGQEVAPASAPAALSPAILAMVGWTDKGPTNDPIRVSGVEEFTRRFGDINNTGIMALCTRAFFGNGGQDLVVVRVAPSDAVASTIDSLRAAPPGTRWTFTAQGEGVWGDELAVLIRGNRNFLDRTTGSYTRYDVLVLQPFAFDPSIEAAVEVYEAVQFDDPDASSYFPDVVNDDRAPSQLIDVLVGVGGTPDELLGSTVAAEVVIASVAATLNQTGTLAAPPVLDLTLVLSAEKTPIVGEVMGIGTGAAKMDLSTLAFVDPAILPGSVTITYNTTTGGPFVITDDGAGNLVGAVDPGATIDYVTGAMTGLSSAIAESAGGDEFLADYTPVLRVTDDGLGNLIGDIDFAGANSIDYTTGVFDVDFASAPAAATALLADYRNLPTETRFDLAGGGDGTAVGRANVSDPALEASEGGIYALDRFEEPVNLVVPDFEGSTLVQGDIMEFCKDRDNRFAILGMSDGATVAQVVQYVLTTQGGVFDERVAAFYWPNVRFVRQDTDTVETVPVTPFVAGVYARTAESKNIGKAPAGVEDGAIDAPGVVGPELDLNQADRDTLYQARINPVYRSLATGYAVWGARTLSLESRWRYVNARLLHNFLMFRIKRLLTIQVFENNGPTLWTQVQQSVRGYMNSLFEQGFFAGNTAAEAFFVRADETNNSQATLKEGKVFLDVGFAPNTPAEFIIFRLQQPVTTVTTGA